MDAARRQIIASSQDRTGLPAPNLMELLEIQSSIYKDKVIYYFLEDGINARSQVSYAELIDAVKKIASNIQATVAEGERALLLFPTGIEFIESLYACFFSRTIGVPSYPPKKNRSFQRFEAIVKDCDPALILTTRKIKDDIDDTFGDEAVFRNRSYLVYEDIIGREGAGWLRPGTDPDDIAFLQYTSGSTGKPNGVVLTHRQVLHNSAFIKEAFRHDENLVGANWLPPFHDMGLIGALLQPLFVGGCNAIIPPHVFLLRPQNWLRAIGKYKVTTAGGPNFALDYCADRIKESDLEGIDLSSVNPFFCGAEPIKKESLERFSAKFINSGFSSGQFYPCYGLAESVLIVTGGHLEDEPVYFDASIRAVEEGRVEAWDGTDKADLRTYVGCGFPMAGTKVAIVDPEKLEICKKGKIGEIWVSGPSVASGYWNNPEKTEEIFNARLRGGEGPWLRTGDLGFIEDGQLFITGRRKDLIIIRGSNFFPQDVEAVVESSHQALNPGSVAAFAIDRGKGEEMAIVAEVRRPAIRDLEPESVFQAVRESVSEAFQVEVSAIELVRPGNVPRTSSGKLRRFECRNDFLLGKLESLRRWDKKDMIQTPEPIVEDMIINWMKEWISRELKIDISSIDAGKPVNEIGLDSVSAVVMARDAGEEFGIEWPLDLFLEETTLEKIAQKGIDLIS